MGLDTRSFRPPGGFGDRLGCPDPGRVSIFLGVRAAGRAALTRFSLRLTLVRAAIIRFVSPYPFLP